MDAKGAKGAKKSGKAGGRSGKSRAAAAAKALVALVVLAAAAAGAYYYFIYSKPAAAAEVEVQQTGVARRGDISVTISGAGPVSYSVRRDVKSEINGSVLKANFSEGELVKAGDVIFEIDNKETLDAISQIENEIKQQEISNASLSPQDFGSMQIYALGNGLVSNVGVHVGDDVNKGSTVMTITDKNSLSALFPFAAEDAALLSVGQDVTLVNLDGEFEECPAKITDIQRDAGGAAAVYVEITAQISQQLKNGTNVAALVKRADLPAQAGLGAAAGGDAGAGAGAGAGEGAGGGGGSGDAGAAGGASGGGSGVAGEGASGGSGNGASGSNGNSGAAGANGAAEAAEAGDGAGVIAEAGAGGGSGAGESEGGDSGAAAGADGGAGAEAGGGQAAGAGAYDSAASDVDAASGESAATAARRAAKAAAAQAQEPAPQAADMRALDTASLSFKSELAVKSLGTGTVTAVNAKENDYVREGQLLVQMSNSDDSYAYSKALNDLKMQNLANNLEAAREKLDDYIIYAPIDGMFVSQPISRDDYIASNQVVCTIVDPDSMEFVTDVDELDIDRVAVGQSVDVSFDAITDTQAIPVKGEIKKIAIEGTSSGGVTTYGVTIGVEPSGRIKAGMNADGVIYIESKSDVVFVPVEAVTLIGGSLAYVYVVDESAAAGEGGEAAAGGAAAGGEAGAEGGAPPAAPAGAGEGAGVDEGAGAGTGGGAGIGNGAGGPGAATADGAGAAVLGDGALGNSGAADGADAPEQAGGEPLSGSGGAPGFRPSFDGSFTGSFGGRPGGGAG
ncbi:MAG: HlyD family efflux transporter periplasmic adaptor subunit, partial [Clostridiales bacterium]|nr:HlyD family efflux transporter periplasmic adaptor subunit [Clostridiales bacterium]